MFTVRAMCWLTYITVAALCSTCSLLQYLKWWPAALNETRRSVSVNVNKGTQDPESWTQYSSLVTALFTVTHSKLQYTWHGDYCEWVRPAQLPVSTQGSSSVPPGTTSTVHSPSGPRRIQQQVWFRTCDTMFTISFTQSTSLLQNTVDRNRMKPNSALPHLMLPQCTMLSLNTDSSIYAFSINLCPLCDTRLQHHACSTTGQRHTTIIFPYS
jgi:hypothetical protein